MAQRQLHATVIINLGKASESKLKISLSVDIRVHRLHMEFQLHSFYCPK